MNEENNQEIELPVSRYDRALPPGSLKRRLVHWIGFPIIIFVVLYIITDNIIMPIITRHGSEFPLADLTGYTLEDARQILESANLNIEVTAEEYLPNKREGIILSQYPIPDTKVKSGRTIKVTITGGQRMVRVPVLAGYSVRQAKLNIESAGLVLGDVAWTFADSLPEKVVVFSYPASGMEMPMGSPVNLMVNRGSLAGVAYMPKLVGLQMVEARKILEERGLKTGLISYIRDENYLPETVLEQSVEEATELEVGEEVDLVVSTTE